MKKEILIIVLKVVIYACTLALGLLGVHAMTSCTYHRGLDSSGRAVVVTVDTTVINHSGSFSVKSK